MITGKTNVLEYLRINNTPFWYIRRSEKAEPIFSSGDIENITLSESINRISQCLDMLDSGTYFIESWTTQDQRKMRHKDSFILKSDGIAGIGNIQQIAPQVSPEDIASQIQKGIENYEKEREIKELKLKIAKLEQEKQELENSIDKSISNIDNRLQKYWPLIEKLLFSQGKNVTQNISGMSPEEKEQYKSSKQAQKRLEAAFEKWMTVENDPITLVEKIADLAVNDKSTYAMAKNILLSK